MSVQLRRACAAFAVLACLAVSPRTVATVAYLQVPTIKGPVSKPAYAGWIQLASYGFSETFLSGKAPATSVLTFVKSVDRTSPAFSDAYFNNTTLKGSTKLQTAAISQTTGKTNPTETVEFFNAVVVSDSGAGGDAGATETITLEFQAISVCVPVNNKPDACAQWDFSKNTPTYPGN
jgi:type VI protein secretion system component Hcp